MRPNPRPLLPLLAAILATACFAPADRGSDQDPVAIGQVQGDGARSPLEGREVVVQGVVTGNFARHLGGWFIQDEGDGDPATSDALFVLTDAGTGVRSGDLIRVRGRVVEHGDRDAPLTALQPLEIDLLGRGEVAPLVLTAPPDDWERLEGMRVRIDAPLTLSGHYDLARHGVLVASFDGRLRAPTEIAAPGADAQAAAEANARRSVVIDDAQLHEHPPRTWYLPDDAQTPRSGSILTGVEGVVDQREGGHRLQLLEPPALDAAPRPAAPEVAGDLRIAVLNLENLFNGDGHGGGFPTARGARTPEELERQLGRLQATFAALAPDVAAVMELENDGYGPESSIALLAGALGGDWRFVDTGTGPGDDAIRVALLYRADAVRPVGDAAALEGGPFGTRSRVPLAQSFVALADGAPAGPPFTVVANHFKSKGCGEAVGLNRDQGDGQGCWNALRVDSARRLKQWLATDPTGSGSDLFAITGDLNAYAMEDPVRTLLDAGWRDAFEGAAPAPHTYVFAAQAGRLDYLLLSPALAARMEGAATWHSNADEPGNIGYRGDNSGELDGKPWRSSDHDPILAGFDLRHR